MHLGLWLCISIKVLILIEHSSAYWIRILSISLLFIIRLIRPGWKNLWMLNLQKSVDTWCSHTYNPVWQQFRLSKGLPHIQGFLSLVRADLPRSFFWPMPHNKIHKAYFYSSDEVRGAPMRSHEKQKHMHHLHFIAQWWKGRNMSWSAPSFF